MKCPNCQRDLTEDFEAAFALGKDKGVELGEGRAAKSYISIIRNLNKQCNKLCETIQILTEMKFKNPQYKRFTNCLLKANIAARKGLIKMDEEEETSLKHFKLSSGDKRLLADILNKQKS